MNEVFLSLTKFELISIGIAVVSLVGNIMQWRERKAWKDPLSNALIALFNDIKATTNYVYYVNNALFNPHNPHKDPLTLRWEYGLFAQSITGYLQGFQEQAVGLLVSLNPKDKEGKRAFRAFGFGMTDNERKLREDHFVRYREAQEAAAKMANQPQPES